MGIPCMPRRPVLGETKLILFENVLEKSGLNFYDSLGKYATAFQ